MNNPVDIIILSWNRVEQTLGAIQSALAQQGIMPRVIVVDQGSTSDTLTQLRRIAELDRRVNLLELGKNYGVSGGRNRGIAHGDAPYIVGIDNDAVFEHEHTIAYAVDKMIAEPDLGIIGFRIRNFYTGGDDRLSWVYPRALLAKRDEEFLATRFCGAGNMIRRANWEKSRGYEEALIFIWEELDLAYQVINQGSRVIYDPKAAVLHKVSPDMRTSWSNNRFFYIVRNAIYLDYKYLRSARRVAVLSCGYLVKGLYNRTLMQSIRGVIGALGLIRRLPSLKIDPLSPEARKYIQENDFAYRGGFLDRLRREVLEALPSDSSLSSEAQPKSSKA